MKKSGLIKVNYLVDSIGYKVRTKSSTPVSLFFEDLPELEEGYYYVLINEDKKGNFEIRANRQRGLEFRLVSHNDWLYCCHKAAIDLFTTEQLAIFRSNELARYNVTFIKAKGTQKNEIRIKNI